MKTRYDEAYSGFVFYNDSCDHSFLKKSRT